MQVDCHYWCYPSLLGSRFATALALLGLGLWKCLDLDAHIIHICIFQIHMIFQDWIIWSKLLRVHLAQSHQAEYSHLIHFGKSYGHRCCCSMGIRGWHSPQSSETPACYFSSFSFCFPYVCGGTICVFMHVICIIWCGSQIRSIMDKWRESLVRWLTLMKPCWNRWSNSWEPVWGSTPSTSTLRVCIVWWKPVVPEPGLKWRFKFSLLGMANLTKNTSRSTLFRP